MGQASMVVDTLWLLCSMYVVFVVDVVMIQGEKVVVQADGDI